MIFNPEVLLLDMYSFPSTTVGILVFAYGIFVFAREHGSQIGLRYLFFTASMALYTFGTGISYAVVDRADSLLWNHIANIGAVTAPFFLYLASVSIIGRTRRQRAVVRIIAGGTLFFLLTLFGTDLVISGNVRLQRVYYASYGPLGHLLLAFYAIVNMFVIACYIREIRGSTDPLLTKRLRLVTVANVIGAFGAIDMLPAVGMRIHAFGYIPIAMFVATMGYAIMRFRLVDLTPEIAAPAILKTMPSGVIVTDRNDVVRIANTAAGKLLDIVGPLVDHTLEGIGETSPPCAEFLGIPADEKNVEISWHRKTNEERTLSVSKATLRDANKLRVGTVFVFRDISERKRAEQVLRRLALHDSLTTLPNRKLFFDRLDQQIRLAERNARTLAVLYIDLDRFKEINDTHGHDSGDIVLRAGASRIVGSVRATDTVARLGGDEFAVILTEIQNIHDVSTIVGTISRAIEQPIRLSNAEITVTASIGVAVWPEDGSTAETLISTADARMYEWKRRR